ncbi:hypothetical protein AB0D84_30335 [Streptomyces sp. NPDC048193]|uniref:hypothetical protein n=1 Tax=unclassified Streptomyces TaxID=2593676 RepID=UPI00342CAE00
MPGQRKRRRAEQDTRRGAAARAAPGTGHWVVLFETQDASHWHAHLRALRGEEWATTRIDTLCGRLTQPTTYRLSVFVPSARR